MKIQGQIEIPLNETGIAQAKKLHDQLLDTKIDLVFTSPLSRAKDTAMIAVGDRNIPIKEDNRLLEEFYGDLEGASRLDNPVYTKQRNSFFKRYPNGESYLDVYARVASFFEDLKKNYDGKVNTVLIVAHGGMSRVVNCYFNDMENEDFPKYGIHNCQVVEYELK
jgi:probable phosphoglycerate mutase